MKELSLKKTLSIKDLDNPRDILNYLQIGTSIPILPELQKYILNDLKFFQAKSKLLEEDGNPTGHILIYNDGKDILYFGYFGVLNQNEKKISFLIDELIKYAKENDYKLIRGPINIPAIIYGWGFMKEGSLENLFIGKPVNPPIYQDLFLKKGFNVKIEEQTWIFSPFLRWNPWKMKQYDFGDYEYFNPKDIDEFMKYKYDFLRVHAQNLPLSSQITPSVAGVIDSYAKFIFEFGYNVMIFFVRYKPTRNIIACGAYLPNPFRKDDKGNYDSCAMYTTACEREHWRKGIAMLMGGATSLLLWEKKIRYGAIIIASDNNPALEMVKQRGAIKGMTHLILEYKT